MHLALTINMSTHSWKWFRICRCRTPIAECRCSSAQFFNCLQVSIGACLRLTLLDQFWNRCQPSYWSFKLLHHWMRCLFWRRVITAGFKFGIVIGQKIFMISIVPGKRAGQPEQCASPRSSKTVVFCGHFPNTNLIRDTQISDVVATQNKIKNKEWEMYLIYCSYQHFNCSKLSNQTNVHEMI